MKAIRKFPVPVLQVTEGVTVVCMGALLEVILGREWWKFHPETQTKVVQKFIQHHGAHYYAEEKWAFDEDDRMYAAFSVYKGVRQAKRYGARMVVVENLS